MMNKALRHCWRTDRGVAATEIAFLTPVMLVGVMMLFELGHVGLVIGIGSVALDKAVQSFRLDDLQGISASQMEDSLKSRMVASAYGYLNNDDLTARVLHFDNLSQLGGGGDAADKGDEEAVSSMPVWSVTVEIKKSFLTPLPELLSLGDTFSYQYKHIFGTELNDGQN